MSEIVSTKGTKSNRDRFYEKIAPMFKNSGYSLVIPSSGKYAHKKIHIINKATRSDDFHIWCHIRNDRLDLLIKNRLIWKIPVELGLKTKNQNIQKDVHLEREDATSFQHMDEDALVDICRYIATELV